MNLKQIKLNNFRCFEDKTFFFHPEFNLIVGKNATGKTAILDAISVAITTWLLGFKHRQDNKTFESSDAFQKFCEDNSWGHFIDFWPIEVKALANCYEHHNIEWSRSKNSPTGNTRYAEASQLIELAKSIDQKLMNDIPLPLISYYGTGRLWQDPRKSKVTPLTKSNIKPSRLDGYKHCVDKRIAVKELIKWFAIQEWQSYQDKQVPFMLNVVKKAILECLEDACDLRYHPKRKELLLETQSGKTYPFAMLSDGQRSLIALIADIAQKAVALNSYLGDDVLKKTEGIVLIDELDLHLHPRWQRRVIDDLRSIFPKIQFICTTHSPFLIQSLRSGEELIMLDGQPTAELANKSLADIAQGIMSINMPNTSRANG